MLRRWHAGALALGLVVTGCGDRAASEGRPGGAPAESPGNEVVALDPALVRNLPAGITEQMVRDGRDQFLVCAPCHGLDGNGTQLGPSLRDARWIGISGGMEEIQQVIREGVAEPREYPVPMPVMGGGRFTDDQLRSLAAYVFAMSRAGGPAAPATPPQDSAR